MPWMKNKRNYCITLLFYHSLSGKRSPAHAQSAGVLEQEIFGIITVTYCHLLR